MTAHLLENDISVFEQSIEQLLRRLAAVDSERLAFENDVGVYGSIINEINASFPVQSLHLLAYGVLLCCQINGQGE